MSKVDEESEEETYKRLKGEMGSMFADVHSSLQKGRLSRKNIIDMIDLIVRRKSIVTSGCAIFRNFLLVNIPCCKRSCLLRTKQHRQQ